jgi:CTP synthase (UTP-ammonia lyase)
MILILGDFDDKFPPHRATNDALDHSRAALGLDVDCEWIAPREFDNADRLERVRRARGIWAAPGSPYSSLGGALAAIAVARTEAIPLLGTCGGFQHVILEFARNVLGFEDAQHAEYDPCASRLIVSKLACSLAGKTLPISLDPLSRAAAIYRQNRVEEEYYCNFGVNPDYVPLLRESELRIAGFDAEGEVRIVELPNHPFYIATLFVPQMRSTPASPHPLVTEFIKQAVARSQSVGNEKTRGG